MRSKEVVGITIIALSLYLLLVFTARSSDHMDAPLHVDHQRNDANITDMYVFNRGVIYGENNLYPYTIIIRPNKQVTNQLSN